MKINCYLRQSKRGAVYVYGEHNNLIVVLSKQEAQDYNLDDVENFSLTKFLDYYKDRSDMRTLRLCWDRKESNVYKEARKTIKEDYENI